METAGIAAGAIAAEQVVSSTLETGLVGYGLVKPTGARPIRPECLEQTSIDGENFSAVASKIHLFSHFTQIVRVVS